MGSSARKVGCKRRWLSDDRILLADSSEHNTKRSLLGCQRDECYSNLGRVMSWVDVGGMADLLLRVFFMRGISCESFPVKVITQFSTLSNHQG